MISVVITSYNYGKYLDSCLESVLSQTCQDFEIIIVNDGSTDNTDAVVLKFLADPRITYIRQENAGQANAKNTGIRNAKGDYVAFLDADDLWECTKLEKQMALFSDPAVGVVYSRSRYIDGEGQPLASSPNPKYLSPRSGKVTEYLCFDNFIPFSSSVVRKGCFERCGLFNESFKMGIDWDLWLRISVTYEFAYVDEPLLVYRIGHPGQMSKNMAIRHRCADRIMQSFLQLHPDAISKDVIHDSLIYTCCSRGYYYAGIDTRQCIKYYLRAMKYNPFILTVYIGLLKCLVKRFLILFYE